jgi:hypothetical protein
MGQDANAVQQAVSRALRDALVTLQRNNEELNQALNDLASSCSSNRPANSLSPALRAQTAAAALMASLDVLARFIATVGQAGMRAGYEEIAAPVVSIPAVAPPPSVPIAPPPSIPTPMAEAAAPAPARMPEPPPPPPPPRVMEPPPPPPPPPAVEEPVPAMATSRLPETVELPEPPAAPPPSLAPVAPAVFDLNSLPAEQQELHRRANRAAKVSMQDIKLLKPKDVQLGRENKDICTRLREDLEKARKEYDRRFKTILDQPVDYFYQWCVDILADGNVEALGEYPYPSPVLRR